MNRVQGAVVVLVFSMASVWGQNQQVSNGTTGTMPQNGAPAAASNQNNISGCMVQHFGNFTVNDAATTKNWQIKGNGANLWNHENHVVKVQGLPDPKSPTPVIYAQNVQDTGETCGNAANTNQTVTGKTGNNGTALNATTTSSTASPTPAVNTPTGVQQRPGGNVQATTGAPAAQNPANTSSVGAPPNWEQAGQSNGAAANNAAAAEQNEVGAPQGTLGVGNNQPNNSTAGPTGQGGTAGAATTTPQANAAGGDAAAPKGTPAAGTIASNAGAQPASDTNASFTGCLTGSQNNYQFKANGKTYRLQGSTNDLGSMLNHQVQLTGEDFNGKAIQVNQARDLGSSCKGK
jgi:hypothetical protein